jgi:hypothetical protein
MMAEVIPYRGPSYLALRYAAMRKKKSFTIVELMATFSHKFTKPYIAGRSLEVLVKHDFLERHGDSWLITPTGRQYLVMTAQNYRGEKGE